MIVSGRGRLLRLAARLDDKRLSVQHAAIEALGGRAALPERVLRAVVARLDNKNMSLQWAAVGILMYQHEIFYRTRLTQLPIASLYITSLKRSFAEQFSWLGYALRSWRNNWLTI